jgi:hypothetical protein
MDVIKKNEDRNGYRFVNTYTVVNLEDMETEIVDKVRSYQQSKDTTYKKPFNIEDLF